jgi:hypothetical protein
MAAAGQISAASVFRVVTTELPGLGACQLLRRLSQLWASRIAPQRVCETNRLMLFGETVAVHCENRTEHTDAVRTSQETHHFSATGTNRLMLFGETVAVHSENHTVHIDTVCGQIAEFRYVKVSDAYNSHKYKKGETTP